MSASWTGRGTAADGVGGGAVSPALRLVAVRHAGQACLLAVLACTALTGVKRPAP